MKKNTLLLLIFIFLQHFNFSVKAQSPTYRLKFKYILTKSKLAEIQAKSFQITGVKDTVYSLCGNSLKVLISQSAGVLKIDPWAITSPDNCSGRPGIINRTTLNELQINMNRKSVGQPTRTIVLPYRTWLIGINAIALKVRPSVTDVDGKKFSANVLASNFSLGPSLGYSFGWTTFTHRSATSWSVTPGASLGFSALSLAKEPLKEKVDVSTSPSNLLLSPSTTLIIARNDIGITFSYGWDKMIGKNKNAWAYQGKGFFGIGVAASLKL